MKNRIYPRIGAAVLAGLVAVVPVVGAVATAPSATAASQSPVFLDEYGNEVEPIAADGARSPYIQPLAEDSLTLDDDATGTGTGDLPADVLDGTTVAPGGDVDPEITPISEDVEIAQINAGPSAAPFLVAGVALMSVLSIGVVAYLLFRRRPLSQS
ncbi:hypothetical protein ET495_14845 [Xylanimonas allomyrinae]|uniref:Uncharacterized protein n=2 Tax=Xylanimonas allomyrinae TaxID=2509459 RepID=A0A4P6EN04_9MICO|nr:hypothetical protein ET495_14845 [Xylanimonas allomyrinae]